MFKKYPKLFLILVVFSLPVFIFTFFLSRQVILRSAEKPKLPNCWKILTDRNLQVSIPYPAHWYELDLSGDKEFKGHCFGLKPGIPFDNRPLYCVEFSPRVFPVDKSGFWSNDKNKQQDFFKYISSLTVGSQFNKAPTIYKIVTKGYFDGFQVVKVIEYTNPDTEGTENSYLISEYLFNSKRGLVRISLSLDSQKDLPGVENIFNTVLNNISFK